MSDLEQKIKEAAEKAALEITQVYNVQRPRGYPSLTNAPVVTISIIIQQQFANILALLAEKDAEIERLRGLVVHGDGSCDRCGKVPAIVMPTSLCDECIEGIKRAESAERERGEWKRIAGEYRNSLADSNEKAIRVCHSELTNICKAYDVLAGEGE